MPIKNDIFLIEGVFFLLTSPLMGDPNLFPKVFDNFPMEIKHAKNKHKSSPNSIILRLQF